MVRGEEGQKLTKDEIIPEPLGSTVRILDFIKSDGIQFEGIKQRKGIK